MERPNEIMVNKNDDANIYILIIVINMIIILLKYGTGVI